MRKRILIGLIFLLGIGLISLIGLIGFKRLFQSPAGRTNFLILGLSGDQRAGADLTDTIIFLSVENRTGKTVLVSLPRDIWIPQWRTKLNSIYHYQGLADTEKAVEEILGIPVSYALVIDFAVFRNLIDVLGGVEVEVERAFDDYRYPILGKENDSCNGDPAYRCRYEHLRFEIGKQWMDGQRALKYVRSRNAEGEEGSDFARSRRQQQLMKAIKDKFNRPSFWLTPGKPLQLFRAIRANVWVDITKDSYYKLIKIVWRMRQAVIVPASLDDYLFSPPFSPTYDRQWVLLPKNGNWGKIHEEIKDLLESN